MFPWVSFNCRPTLKKIDESIEIKSVDTQVVILIFWSFRWLGYFFILFHHACPKHSAKNKLRVFFFSQVYYWVKGSRRLLIGQQIGHAPESTPHDGQTNSHGEKLLLILDGRAEVTIA